MEVMGVVKGSLRIGIDWEGGKKEPDKKRGMKEEAEEWREEEGGRMVTGKWMN